MDAELLYQTDDEQQHGHEKLKICRVQQRYGGQNESNSNVCMTLLRDQIAINFPTSRLPFPLSHNFILNRIKAGM